MMSAGTDKGIDTRMKFSVDPPGGDSAFEQWKDAMKAVARLPLGIPAEFRKKVWLSLADHHIANMRIDWEKTIKFAFNERSNPDDNKLGLQIVKDLHRTGCSGFSGEDNDEERAVLKRILLAYARWNKAVGYCQGFNMIAALLLDVMDRNESDALKVMIYLIDHVLPQGYFANNLRALSVDMAVFRDLLKVFPKLSRHLDYLQHAQDQTSGGCYEPPLTNVFTMQWFLTLFATCLPKCTVLRVWDSILLDGSEILLRTALVIWGKLSSRILTVSSADEFYTLMGDITQEMLEGNVLDADSIIKSIYCIAPFPLPQLTELREKYTYNIRPFTPSTKKATWPEGTTLPSDEDDIEDEDLENITCFTGFIPTNVTTKHHKGLEGDQRTGSLPDISSLGPGAYGLGPADGSGMSNVPAYMERMTTDISALKKQYTKLRQRQNQAHIILSSASAKQQVSKAKAMMPHIESPIAMNHLFLSKQDFKGRNRFVAEGPRISNMYPWLQSKELSKQRKMKSKSKQSKVEKETNSQQLKQSKINTSVVESSVSVSTEVEIHNECTDDSKVGKGSNQAKKDDIKELDNCTGVNSEDSGAIKQDNNEDKDIDNDETNDAHHQDDVSNADNVIDTESDSKCMSDIGHSPHRDSGVGNSLCSSGLSCSSNENSPQHFAFSPSHNTSFTKRSELSDNFENVIVNKSAELEAIDCKSIMKQKMSEHLLNVLGANTDHTSAMNDIVENKDDSKNDEEANDIDCDIIRESGDTKICVHDDRKSNDEQNGASCQGDNGNFEVKSSMKGRSIKKEFNEDIEVNKVSDINCDADEDGTRKIENTDKPIQSEKFPKETGNGSESRCFSRSKVIHESDGVYVSKKSDKMRISSSDTYTAKSAHLSDSSNTTIVSAEDNDALSEVFTTNTSASQASFQQYYINKRNLSSESPHHGIESQCKKTQMPKKLFNPFPVKHINQNRARTGIKLGLYKPSTLQEFEKNLNKNQPVWGK
ncbi:hypothetical protein ACF0H5_013970 [Mactra antiquata]